MFLSSDEGFISDLLFVSSDMVKGVAFDPQNPNILASCSRDKTIKIWDVTSGSCLSTLRAHSWANPECKCKHNGPYEANPQCPVTGHSEGVNCVVFSPNGKVIASCSGEGYKRDNSVRLWDAATGAAIGSPLRGHRYDPSPCMPSFVNLN